MNAVLPCRIITVVAFAGDHSHAFVRAFLKALDDEKNGRGRGPSLLDSLLYAGHAGVSTDGRKVVYAFNPDAANLPVWQVMDRLKRGEAFPGIVRDDTAVFAAAGPPVAASKRLPTAALGCRVPTLAPHPATPPPDWPVPHWHC